jgi:hypothetical protein
MIISVAAIYNELPARHVAGNGFAANDFQGQN